MVGGRGLGGRLFSQPLTPTGGKKHGQNRKGLKNWWACIQENFHPMGEKILKKNPRFAVLSRKDWSAKLWGGKKPRAKAGAESYTACDTACVCDHISGHLMHKFVITSAFLFCVEKYFECTYLSLFAAHAKNWPYKIHSTDFSTLTCVKFSTLTCVKKCTVH